MPWWVWGIGAVVAGMASGMSAMLSLSAGTAYGRDYHSLSPAQRMMARFEKLVLEGVDHHR